MTRDVAVSVIVPIYNVEKYLDRCLSSLRDQTFSNFNVIMIDDGSDDGSAVIAQSYEEKDSRFIYKRTNRSGVAQARNIGLGMSDGEYIAFVDSDDYVDKTYLEKLYNAAVNNNCKISSCNYALIYEKEPNVCKPVKIRKLKSGVYSKKKYLTKVIRDWSVRSYLWNKLWHRSLFVDNNISFPMMYFEDIATVARLVFNTNSVAIIDEPLYNYFVRGNSIMTTVRVEKINDYILSYGIVRNYIQYRGEYKQYRMAFLRFAMIVFFANHYNIFQLHWVCKNFKGWFKNQYIANKNILTFALGNFNATDDLPELPQYIFAPENKM